MRWIFPILTGALFLWIAAMNNFTVWVVIVQPEKRRPSWIPLMGGVCGVMSLWSMPVAGAIRWWWVPLILDYGSAPGMVATIAQIFMRRSRGPGPK